jgi:hypothetical protein
MDLLTVLRQLYAREINVTIESDWDNGFTVAIGNQRNGLAMSEHFTADELGRAVEWLEQTAANLYRADRDGRRRRLPAHPPRAVARWADSDRIGLPREENPRALSARNAANGGVDPPPALLAHGGASSPVLHSSLTTLSRPMR